MTDQQVTKVFNLLCKLGLTSKYHKRDKDQIVEWFLKYLGNITA